MSLFHNNVIKAERASQNEQVAEIKTNFTVYKPEPPQVDKVKEERIQKANQLLQEAADEKAQLLAEAQQEAEALKEQARAVGLEEGKEQGYQEGYTNGYAEATAEGQRVAAELKQNAQQMIQQAETQVNAYYEEKQDQLIQLAATMAEAIVHQTIDTADDQVLQLVKPILLRMSKTEKLVTVTVRPEQEEVIKEKLAVLEAKQPDVRFVLFTDYTLEKNGCVVETRHNITDLQVGKQLNKMVEEMQKME